jgi:hypothetical protein
MSARRKKRKHEDTPEDGVIGEQEKVKVAKPVSPLAGIRPMKLIRQMLSNPDIGYQAMVVLLALTSDQVKMDRRINTMSSSIDSLRNITEVLNTSVRSLKTAAEAPRQIRKLINPGNG